MNKIKVGFVVLLALFTVGTISCKKKVKEVNTIAYWYKPFLAGNFTINSTDLPIYNDASNNTQTANFIKQTEAPDGDFIEIGLKWYIPTDTTLYATTIADPTSEVLVNDVNIPLPVTVAFQNNIIIDSVQYSIYKIEILPTANTVDKISFENVKFSAQFSYTDGNGNGNVTNRSLTSNIYKKDL